MAPVALEIVVPVVLGLPVAAVTEDVELPVEVADVHGSSCSSWQTYWWIELKTVPFPKRRISGGASAQPEGPAATPVVSFVGKLESSGMLFFESPKHTVTSSTDS